MNAEHIKAFRAHLLKKDIGGQCLCGKNEWVVEGPVHLLNGSQLNLGPKASTLPMVAQVCSACGYARMYSWLMVLGPLPE
jgi:hypothetical protein